MHDKKSCNPRRSRLKNKAGRWIDRSAHFLTETGRPPFRETPCVVAQQRRVFACGSPKLNIPRRWKKKATRSQQQKKKDDGVNAVTDGTVATDGSRGRGVGLVAANRARRTARARGEARRKPRFMRHVTAE
jgi:hypothetical protein